MFLRYLIHRHSGPLIDRGTAHRSLAFACICYLNTRFDFKGPLLQKSDIESRLVISFGGLDDYASHFWIDHVLAYMRVTPNDSRCTELIETLNFFSMFWKQDQPSSMVHKKTKQYIEISSLLASHTTIHDMVQQVLVFREISKLHEEISESSDCMYLAFIDAELLIKIVVLLQWQLDHDPTYLTHVVAKASDSIQSLLAIPLDNVPTHLDSAKLRRFQQLYGSLGFRCRKSSCRKVTMI